MFDRVGKIDQRSQRRRMAEPKRAPARRRVVRWLLILTAAVIVVDAVVGEQGLLALQRAKRDYQRLSESLERQRTENDRLREEARRLREDPSAIEEVARRELGLIRPGEKVFIIRDLPSAGH